MTSISVIVVNYNAGAYLKRCLDALGAQTFGDFEILVADNGSTDGSLSLAEGRARILRLERNAGFAAANNAAARAAQGRWLAFLNPDAFPEPDWLAHLDEATRRWPDVAAFGSTQVMANDPSRLDGVGDAYFAAGLPWRTGYGVPRVEVPPETEPFSICAAAALYRRDVFEALGGFDERYFCYCEDVDLGFRLRLAGGRCAQVAEAVVHHVGSGVAGAQSAFVRYHGTRNLIWTFAKDMPGWLFWLLLPAHAGVLAVLVAKAGARGDGGPILRGIYDALRGMAPVLAERRRLQRVRRASVWTLARAFVWSPFAYLLRRRSGTAARLLARGAFGELACRALQRLGVTVPARALPRPPALKRAGRSARQLRVVMASHNLELEGAPISLFELASGLKARGLAAPHIVAPEPGPLETQYAGKGIAVTYVPQNRALTRSDYDRAVERYASRLMALQPDVVAANTLRAFDAVDAARIAGIPSIWIIRESEPLPTHFIDRGCGIRRRALACFGYPERIVFVSDACRAQYPLVKQATVIRNVLDPARLDNSESRDQARASLGIEPNECLVLSVGTVCENKGQLDLVDAAASLPPHVRVHIVGDRGGGYAELLRRRIAGLPHIRMVPPTENIARYWRAADIFVLTSRIESYPRVVLEAMAYGLAIIAAPVFGIKEQLRDRETALFYPPRDIAGLGTRIAELVSDAGLRIRLGAAARRASTESGFDMMIASYANILSGVR